MTADQKGSAALEQGKKLLWYGLVFYIVSMTTVHALWRMADPKGEAAPVHIFATASCSFLFIAMEVIGGWFLTQHRRFVGIATHFFKIKVLLDRYLLAYLASPTNAAILQKMLEADMKWPDLGSLDDQEGPAIKEVVGAAKSIVEILKPVTPPPSR